MRGTVLWRALMDAITSALVSTVAAASSLALKGVASAAVRDAYKALKERLAGRMATLAILEKDPSQEAFLEAAATEMKLAGLSQDPAVIEGVWELVRAIEHEAEGQVA